MRTIVVTGSASGMGAATAARLRLAGDRVIGVDLRDADVIADLATDAGRAAAVHGVLEACNGELDGAVCAAGLGPTRDRERTILEVNYLGVVDLLTGWRDALATGKPGRAVVVGSNSSTTTPMVSRRAIKALAERDLDRAEQALSRPRRVAPAMSYAASKIAVTRWARRTAVTPQWAGSGLRLNVVAPGAVATPMLAEQLKGPEAKNVERFPIPAGAPGRPEQLATWIEILLSEAADYLVGTVITVDGGSEALFRADHWPAPIPARHLPGFARKMFGRRS